MKQHNSIIVKSRYNGLRLDQYLVEVYDFLTTQQPDRENIRRLIENQMVLVEGKIVRPSHRVKPGETVMILKERSSEGTKESPPKIPIIPVLYENEDLLVINKPAGLSMHPSSEGQKGTLVDWIALKHPKLLEVGENPLRPGIVHRLDKETSGLVVLAKTNDSFQALKRLFQERLVEKTYTALVYGVVKDKRGVIEASIGRIEKSNRRGIPLKKRVFSGSLRESRTEYELSTIYPQYSLLFVKPKTGRTHQIRVHLASIGHPVVGDQLYCHKIHRKDPLTPPHQLLHAQELRFTLMGKKYALTAPLPDYFVQALDSLDGKS